MLNTILSWLTASGSPTNTLYILLLLVSFAIVGGLTATYRRIIRRSRERFDDLIAKHHNLRDAYAYLRAEYNVLLNELDDGSGPPDEEDEDLDEEDEIEGEVTHART